MNFVQPCSLIAVVAAAVATFATFAYATAVAGWSLKVLLPPTTVYRLPFSTLMVSVMVTSSFIFVNLKFHSHNGLVNTHAFNVRPSLCDQSV